MSEQLGKTFQTGSPAPETGTYQLVNDRPADADPRTDRSRVIRLEQGDPIPPHPDTGSPTQWRFMRLAKPYQFQG
ncbi:MAG: YjzC family protein [Chloroflexota bacterium]|jgi:hypothetical protein|nr:YjzC family protein [Anaerolineae bacterium]HMM28662.1 YjzC family protein [Aggregatilineaceae bacterium]